MSVYVNIFLLRTFLFQNMTVILNSLASNNQELLKQCQQLNRDLLNEQVRTSTTSNGENKQSNTELKVTVQFVTFSPFYLSCVNK